MVQVRMGDVAPSTPYIPRVPDKVVPTPYTLQGYLAHKKTPTPLGQPHDPRHSPNVGSWEGAVSYERGTPVHPTPYSLASE